MDESILYFSWISERLSSCSAAFKKLYDFLGSAKDIYNTKDYSKFNLTEKQTASLMNKDLSSSQRAINSAVNLGFSVIHYADERYPLKLKKFSTPPPILFYKGKWVDFDRYYSAGVVGTRQPSAEGLQKTRTISRGLAEKGVIIISGLAFGVDYEAHKEALKSKSFTVGISGVKSGQIYPKENSRLYSDMYKNGLVISEHSPMAKISKNSFPVRNRIISALSDVILMMEAPAKSGAIITAENALSSKKCVFVPFGDEKYNEGGNALFKKGAIPLLSKDDVLEHLEKLNGKEYYTEKSEATLDEEIKEILNKNSDKSNVDLSTKFPPDIVTDIPENTHNNSDKIYDIPKDIHSTSNDVYNVPEDLSEIEKKIYAFISSNDSVSADSIISGLNIGRNDILSSLSMLEIYGYVIRIPGDKWKLI